MSQRSLLWAAATTNSLEVFRGRFAFFCTGFSCALISAASAAWPIPKELTPATSDLAAERNALVQRSDALKTELSQQDAQCKNVKEKTPEASHCREWKDKLLGEYKSYSSAVDAFNRKISDAERSTPTPTATPTPTPLDTHTARVRATGECYYYAKDGRKISCGTTIPLSDQPRIVTGANSHVSIDLPDETVFTLGPNSDMVLDEFVYDPNETHSKIIAKLAKGLFRWVTGHIACRDPQTMRLHLPAGTIGCRGTDFETNVEADNSGSVRLTSGTIEYTSKTNESKIVLQAGQMLRFDSNGAITGLMPIGGDATSPPAQNFPSTTPQASAENSPATPSPTATATPSTPSPVPTAATSESFPGEHFPETRTRVLSREEVESWPEAKLRYAINEMFARRGGGFSDPKLTAEFAKFSWYHPNKSLTLDQIESSMPDIEKQNVKTLGAVRDAKHAHPTPRPRTRKRR